MKTELEDFEVALRTLSDRARTDESFAQELYASLCNMRWRCTDSKAEPVSMSWRYAGGVVSHLTCKGGCYLDYYCSGGEGAISDRVLKALAARGWEPDPWPNDAVDKR